MAKNYVDSGAGKTTSVMDANNASNLITQSNDSFRAAAPAAHADFNGQLCLTMTGNLFYDTNQAASFWAFAHQPGVIYDISTPISVAGTQVVWETTNNFATAFIQRYWAGNQSQHTMRPQASPVANATAIAGTSLAGSPMVARTRVDSTTLYGKRTGLSEQTAALASAPDASSPSRGLGLGRNGLTSDYRWALLAFFPVLTAGQMALVESWISQTYGLAT